MPRRLELTWQGGSPGRGGRWKKCYKGRVLYFRHGTSKSDIEGYRQALAEWHKMRAEIDAEVRASPKPHEEEYAREISTWSTVQTWSQTHADQDYATLAERKLKELTQRAARVAPPPLLPGDSFWEHLRSHADGQIVKLDLGSVFAEREGGERRQAGDGADALPGGVIVHVPLAIAAELDGSPERISREIWRDRLSVQSRQEPCVERTLGGAVDMFLRAKHARMEAGELSPIRYSKIVLHLGYFREWAGAGVPVDRINSQTLLAYHARLLDFIRREEYKPTYAKEVLENVKSFLRWCYQSEIIDKLPRNLDSNALHIGRNPVTVVVFTKDEIGRLLSAATERTKLYILLMLNCGMTQKDISDLRVAEVDFEKGTITRRRSKTKRHRNVPVVTYRLWYETLRLLRQERAAEGDRVLLNEEGRPLRQESADPDGRLRKLDNVRTAFDRLRRKLGITKTLSSLKKTSATLLRGNREFRGLEDLLLGHAPKRISDRHYTQEPQTLLDEAISWLGRELGVEPA